MKRPKADEQLLIVLPGDDITSHILPKNPSDDDSSSNNNNNSGKNSKKKQLKLGIGLSYDESTQRIKATLAGRLYHRSSTNTYFILHNMKRYVPQTNDRVVCIVEERIGEHYRVTIPGSSVGSALLNQISFEGATKRNKPNLVTGSLVYARIERCDIAVMEPEVTCKVSPSEENGLQDGGASKKDWMTDEGTYGELKGGSCTQMSIGLARELLRPDNVLLEALGAAQIPFEIVIGVNGLIWVHSERPLYTVMILNAIRNSEVMTEAQVKGMVKSLVKSVKASLLED